MHPVKLPKYIDDPITLLIWSADEFVPFTLVLLIGMLIGQLLVALLLSLVVIKFYRRYRESRPDGYIQHALYWLGLYQGHIRTRPNPYIRTFYP